MAIEKVRAFFAEHGMADRVMEFDTSSATVELAAQAVGTIPARIAKTLSFRQGDSCLLIVTAGDAKIDNAKFKAQFQMKATMPGAEDVLAMTGHAVGGVCPFAVNRGIPIYLDVSLRRFDTVYPACGSANSAIGLAPDTMYTLANAQAWVDVCKGWEASV